MTLTMVGGGTVDVRQADVVAVRATAAGCDVELRSGDVLHLTASAVDVQRLLVSNPHALPGMVERLVALALVLATAGCGNVATLPGETAICKSFVSGSPTGMLQFPGTKVATCVGVAPFVLMLPTIVPRNCVSAGAECEFWRSWKCKYGPSAGQCVSSCDECPSE